jgi:hypothetical protein
MYGENPKVDQRKYILSHYKGSTKGDISGELAKPHINTSFAARQKLIMRMRRFTHA